MNKVIKFFMIVAMVCMVYFVGRVVIKEVGTIQYIDKINKLLDKEDFDSIGGRVG